MDGDATSLFTTSDPSLAYLSYIWGTGLFAGGSASTTVLSTAVGSLTTVVLAVAGLFFMYQLIAGTVQSAHHGEVLGKEWSSLWVPVRFTLAGAALLPVGTGGAIGIQMAIAFMVKIALNAAGYIAITAMSALAAGQPLSAPAMPSVDKMAEQAWDLVVCAEGLNTLGTTLGGSSNGAIVGSITVNSTAGAFGLIDNVKTPGGTFSPAFCPTIIVPLPQPTNALGVSISYTQFAEARVTAIQGLINSFQPIVHDLAAASRPCPSDSNGSCGSLSNNVGNIANSIVTAQNNFDIQMGGALNGVRASVQTSMGNLQNQGMNGSGQNTTGAGINYSSPASCGFVCLGAFYNQIAAINGNLVSAISTDSKSMGGSADADDVLSSEGPIDAAALGQTNLFHGEQAAFLAAAAEEFSYRDDYSKFTWSPPLPIIGNYNPHSGSAPQGSEGGVSSWIQGKAKAVSEISASRIVTKYMAEFVYTYSQIGPSSVNSANPISSLSSIGAGMEAASLSFKAAMTVVPSFVGGLVDDTRTVIGYIEAGAVFLSQILPMLPYIMWLLAVIAYFTFVTEALVSAPLWGFAHLKAGGDGIHGEAGNGYMMVLTLLFMPSLMVIGYIAGMALMSMGIEILNNTYALASASASNANAGTQMGGAAAVSLLTFKSFGIAGLASMIVNIAVKLLVYCTLAVLIIERSFKLITLLPAAVLKWVGGNADSWSGAAAEGHGELRNNVGKALSNGKYGVF